MHKILRNYIFFLSSLSLTLILYSCHTVNLTTALQEYGNGEYYKASQSFKTLYKKTDVKKERKLKGELAWYMACCYDELMWWQQAGAYYQRALRYGCDKDSIENIEMRLALTKQKTTALKNVTPSRYSIKKFNLVNTTRAEFSPAIWGENDTELYYTTNNEKVTGEDKSNVTGTKYFDIWVTKKDENGVWQKPVSAGEALNTNNDEGAPSFSPDGNTMFFSVAGGGEDMSTQPQIFYSSRSEASWGKGERLTISKDSIYTYAHPAVSPDGRWLYFVSDIPGGYGGLDIWRATLNGTKVGAYENLGSEVNSAGDEMFPTMSPQGILYYSSEGKKEGYGGLDIYSAREDEWGIWHVAHLPAPINSQADDFGMTFMRSTKEEQEGWFSSNRNHGKGYDKIYSFVLPSIKVSIKGTVYDNEDNPVAEAIVRVVGRNGMNFKSVTKPDGTYEVSIDRSTEYVMMSGKNGYLNRKAQLMSSGDEKDAQYIVDFQLPCISKPIVVENVFYDYNKATLREESFPSLDELVSLLKDNPYTQIELSSHTDRVGSQEFNLNLSTRRAESVCQYLISHGIEPARVVPVGYGKEQPFVIDEKYSERYGFPVDQELTEEYISTLEPEKQEIADQINRRTQFVVLTTTFGIK